LDFWDAKRHCFVVFALALGQAIEAAEIAGFVYREA
jgi:hypothetical protein